MLQLNALYATTQCLIVCKPMLYTLQVNAS